MTDLVNIEHLVKYFDIGRNQRVHAVDDVSLKIGEREIVGLVGHRKSLENFQFEYIPIDQTIQQTSKQFKEASQDNFCSKYLPLY